MKVEEAAKLMRSQLGNTGVHYAAVKALVEFAESGARAVDLTDEQIDAVTVHQWGEQIGAMKQAHRAYARAILSEVNSITEKYKP